MEQIVQGVAQSKLITGAEGIIKNEHGDWIAGFMVNLGNCIVEVAELWVALHGLRLAWESGARQTIIESILSWWLSG